MIITCLRHRFESKSDYLFIFFVTIFFNLELVVNIDETSGINKKFSYLKQ